MRWHRPLFHFPHYEPEQSAAPTYTHDLEQMHPKAHARDGRGSKLSNDRPQSSPGGGSTDALSAQPTAPHHFLAENAARCIGHRSALLSSSQRAATGIAPQCTKMKKTAKNSRQRISPSHERSSYTFPTLQQGPVARHFHSPGEPPTRGIAQHASRGTCRDAVEEGQPHERHRTARRKPFLPFGEREQACQPPDFLHFPRPRHPFIHRKALSLRTRGRAAMRRHRRKDYAQTQSQRTHGRAVCREGKPCRPTL